MKRLLSTVAAAALLALPGCGIGSDDAGGGGDDSDKRALALECFEEEEVAARLEGEEGDEEIVIGDGADAPRIKFFLTAGEAEGAQFAGDGEGTEQIGQTLLYVKGGSDELLETVEGCLAGL
ncbi:MAG TPA: hypothetical protein VES62_03175 [Thermoleophilaceae bacterium]|nr:hypothetical protein [Thermoleophilaceae bacterium]